MPNPAGHGLSTGLPDRLLLHDRLSHALAQCRRYNGLLGLIQIDLEGLEHSHALGADGPDRLLREIATRLRTLLRASDTIAPIDGRGLALILPDLADQNAAAMIADKIVAAFESGFEIDGHSLRPRASLGIVVVPANGKTPEQLLQDVALAAAHAKAAGVRIYRRACAAI